MENRINITRLLNISFLYKAVMHTPQYKPKEGTFDEKKYIHMNHDLIIDNLKDKGFKEIVYRDDNETITISYGINDEFLNLKGIMDIISQNKIYEKNNYFNITYFSQKLPYSEFFKHFLEDTQTEKEYGDADKIEKKIKSLNRKKKNNIINRIFGTNDNTDKQIEIQEDKLATIYKKLIESASNSKPDKIDMIYHESYDGKYFIELRDRLDVFDKCEKFNYATHEIIENMKYATPSFSMNINRDNRGGYTIDIIILKKEFSHKTKYGEPQVKISKLNNIMNSLSNQSRMSIILSVES